MQGAVRVRPRRGGVSEDLGRPALPGCKSHGQRALILAALLDGHTTLGGMLDAVDSRTLADALRALGAKIDWPEASTTPRVRGVASVPLELREALWFGENGTGVRALGAVLAVLGVEARLDGAPGLRRRPMTPLADLVRRVGGRVDAAPGDHLPMACAPGTVGAWGRALDAEGSLPVDAGATTQVASGAALGVALLGARAATARDSATDVRGVRAVAPRASGYLEITHAVLRLLGWDEARLSTDGADLVLWPGPRVRHPERVELPRDASSTTWPLALAGLHGLDVGRVPDPGGAHPERRMREVVQMLASACGGGTVEVEGIAAFPDGFPAACVVAAGAVRRADGPDVVRIAGAPSLRIKESDRITAMADVLRASGAALAVDELEDGLVLRRADPAPHVGSRPSRLPTVADHRIVMAAALLATALRDGPAEGVAIPHADAVAKSWPGFWDWFGAVADVEPCAGGGMG